MNTKLNENSVKTHIEVKGVVFTETALVELEHWQKDRNTALNMHRETISDTICYLATKLAELDYDPEVPTIMESLGYLRESLKKLTRP